MTMIESVSGSGCDSVDTIAIAIRREHIKRGSDHKNHQIFHSCMQTEAIAPKCFQRGALHVAPKHELIWTLGGSFPHLAL